MTTTAAPPGSILTGFCGISRHDSCPSVLTSGPRRWSCSCDCHTPRIAVARVLAVGVDADAFTRLLGALTDAYGPATTCKADGSWLVVSRPVAS